MDVNLRRCVSCRRVSPKQTLWRIVRVYPSGQVQLDQGIGRSAYLCPSPTCLRQAQQKNRLGRALKTPIPDPIYQILAERLP